ncbi:DUF4079 family protein [Spirulina major]|uniref:DUF4079 family protein n=1 Tax=Spirulina major TaxID=270636 RepID=UPI0009336B37
MSFELPESVKVYSQFFHPILMWVLLGLSIYAFYLGSQSRKLRKADKEVRKEMIGKKFTERHYRIGSILLALMVTGTVGGMAVTYINNGKLFVGPHLIAGLGMTAMIAISASLVPFMQKGNNLARITHISLNIFLLGLFGWQAFSGMDIVTRILGSF